MQEYVLVYCAKKNFVPELFGFNPELQVLMILKNRPEWQANRLNLVGGKIEAGENAIQCAARELCEETGLIARELFPMGKVQGKDALVYCFVAAVDWDKELRPREDETEIVQWMDLHEALEDPRLMPNLKAIIPMLRCSVGGWTITHPDTEEGVSSSFSISF